ncbi:MAG TPA: hypothetical protein VE338_19125 [Ktedonobacterales bacterium]|jgi:hypothetical protein|nr:hypothetical protein [Ktedonobacterales bacterium]
MNREQTIERTRMWARRAQSEAQNADTRADALNWRGQAQALNGVASFLGEQGAQLDDFAIWSQVVADREKARIAWIETQEGPEVSFYAGQVAGFDVALTALKDVDGVVWPRVEPHIG